MAIDVDAYYRRYGPMVFRRCRQMLRDDGKAEDAMHDVFVEILRREDVIEDRAPSSLLYRIATNVCLNRLRSIRRRPEELDTELLGRIAVVSEPEVGFARALLQRIFASSLESTRAIAVMHLVDGMTLEEVAAEVGLSVSGVRKRLRTLRAQAAELESV